ncbi:Hypothetical protein SRAE_1000265100 [Strongyloides ratti]|uniref:Uncharacterized protein n=1 Tax=Strongyloides ratti TaxID=34506 RepID=A0A090L3U7_STRRB|nr:Hypothetical protein SRAE_1000265100 [Strongyloides ratti]CEF64397.1 Hypothetical protein SRAE_1000265100 [Strongyloides ratti]
MNIKFLLLFLLICYQKVSTTVQKKVYGIDKLKALAEVLEDSDDLIEIKQIVLKKLRYQRHLEKKYNGKLPHEGKIVKKHKRRSLNDTYKNEKGNGKNQVMLTKPYWPWP